MIADERLNDVGRQSKMTVSKEVVEKLATTFKELWDEGKLTEACQVYAEDAQHVVNGAAIYSRDNIVAHYRKLYPTPEDMGALTLTLIDFSEGLGPKGQGANAAFNLSIETVAGKKITGRVDVVYGVREGLVQVTQDSTYCKAIH